MKCILCEKDSAQASIQEAEGLRVAGVNAAWRYLNRKDPNEPNTIWGGVAVGSIASSIFWLFVIVAIAATK